MEKWKTICFSHWGASEASEAVNCERSEQEGEEPYSMAQIIFPTICFRIGERAKRVRQ